MKFFWKLYFSIMTIMLICFSVGGYMLIQTNFNNSFEREIESVYQENDILVNSFTLELYPYLEELTLKEETSKERFNSLENLFSNMIVETFNGSVSFVFEMKMEILFIKIMLLKMINNFLRKYLKMKEAMLF